MPLVNPRGERITELLRISVHDERETKWLRLEGRITGLWSEEFERAWRDLAATLGKKRFGVDLRGVTHMDLRARRVLADIHRETGAQFLADSPNTNYFAEEARRENESKQEE